jgi:UDP-MurNAc hydroxylase
VVQPVDDVDAFFAAKEEHLKAYAQRKRPVIEAAKASWQHPEIDVLNEMKLRIEPLLEESIYLANGVGGPVRFDLITRDGDGESVESIVVDFPGKQVRRHVDEKVRYRFRTDRSLVEHLLFIGEVDWVNSLFLSCRFSAARIGQYNEFVYAFFKCLSEERLQYAEGWYDEHQRTTDAEDITLGDWVVQRRCPHLKADLTRFGIVDGGTLTCQLHGWKFDLASGRCLTSVGHTLRAHHREDEPVGATAPEARPASSALAAQVPSEVVAAPADSSPADSVPAESIRGESTRAESTRSESVPAESIRGESVSTQSVPSTEAN